MTNNIDQKVTIKDWYLITFFALAKLLVHFFTYTNSELHRDAYLYYAQSQHLEWGYIAVPPMIAIIGKLTTSIFGDTVFALRLFPALIGAVNLIIIGLAVKELGGKKIAIVLACFAFLLSPSYLHTNALFQPVAFNQFFWLLSSYLILILINRRNPRTWIWIGFVFGLAFLTKYSIAFFFAAFGLSLLISAHRNLYLSKYFLLGGIIGFVIISPNLIWQYEHNWPVLSHMSELRETQLVHVKVGDFLISQLMMNIHAILIWVTAIFVLLFYKKESHFRIFSFTYLFIILILLLGSGKAYYALGIYPILFVFGCYFIEKYIKTYKVLLVTSIIISMCISLYVSLRFDGVPFLSPEQMKDEGAFTWEDGVAHDIPQDMADMTGWKEIGLAVRDIYMSLEKEQRNTCDIFCYHYGQAGAVMFYGKNDELPQPICDNGSFIFWSPDSISSQYIIWVHAGAETDFNPDEELPKRFEKITLKATINNPYFRENGTRIFLCEKPTAFWKNLMKEELGAQKMRYSRK